MGIFFMLTWSPCSGSRFQCMFVWTAKASAKGIPSGEEETLFVGLDHM